MITTKTGKELFKESTEFTTKKYSRKDIVREVQNAIAKIEEEAVANYIHSQKTRNYHIEDEKSGDCEWETFTVGSICKKDAVKVIVVPQEDNPEFHWAHLCEVHIQVWEDDQRREI